MKIQESLVWSKHTGDLIGFVDLRDVNLNYATLQETKAIASHVLAFLLRSVVNSFKFSLANFATKNATATQIFPLFWKAVAIFETQYAIKVVAATCDEVSVNRKIFRMHFGLTDEYELNADTDVVYRTKNFFSEDKRYIYFIFDPPHLLKTARNCLNNSGSGKGTCFMWNGGLFLIWKNINDIFLEDQECGLQLLPKITYEQLLSTTVSKILCNYGPTDAAGTAEFCLMFDKFFDIMNVSSATASSRELKPFNAPFSSADDPRFSWLKNQFLEYFEDWLRSIEERPGAYGKSEKQKMFISSQTYESLKITAHSVIELVKFLIMHKVSYVLTKVFCQDPLENYFGKQRSSGALKDNSSLYDFGYNDNTIRNQKVFKPIATGNVRDEHINFEIDTQPVPCRKKYKQSNL